MTKANVATNDTSQERVDKISEIVHEPVCDKDPQGCWNVRCQLGKKCKNTPPQRKPEQEPMALIYDPITGSITPPQRKPLTDEEIILIVAECAASHQHTDIHFARAIERAHGIKELV